VKRINEALVGPLARHRVPAIGFVNEGKLQVIVGAVGVEDGAGVAGGGSGRIGAGAAIGSRPEPVSQRAERRLQS
jgi:hypothetical protein